MALTSLGVHIYSGAFTIGMDRHFKSLGQLEEGPWGYNTFALNYPHLDHPLGKENWDLSKYKNYANVVYSNPPCACWSMIGAKLGHKDPRLQFTYNCAEVGLEVEPQFFVLESVCRAWSAGRDVYEGIAERFLQKGYAITYLLTNALLHGAPQSRERFHLIAHKYDLPLETPSTPQIKTVRQTIADIEDSAVYLGEGDPVLPNHTVRQPNIGEAEVYKVLRAQDDYNAVAEKLINEGRPARKGRMIAHRLYWDTVASTAVDIGCLVHPGSNRLLTMRESARLCTYPDDYVFAPNPKNPEFGAAASDVTQAVLPVMGDYLGDLFKRALESEAPAKGTQLVDWRRIARPFTPGRYARSMGWR